MTSGQKIAFSFLSTVILFAGFIVCANAGLFNKLETRYYSQSKIYEKEQQLDKIADGVNSYIQNILAKIDGNETSYLKSPDVASFIDQNPSESQVIARRILTEQLFTDLPDLTGIRIIDKNGKNVHFSTFDNTDVLKQNGITKVYKYYPDILKDAYEISFSVIQTDSIKRESKIYIDSSRKRLIISFPFYWFNNIYAGTLVCYFNIYDVEQYLINSKVLPYGITVVPYSNQNYSGGITVGVPLKNSKEFEEPVLKHWNAKEEKQIEKILAIEDGRYWMLLSSKKSSFINISGVYTSDIFELSDEIIYLIYACVAISLFLIAFLIFSFASPKEIVIKKKIKRIQYGIIKEYVENKERIEWNKAVAQLKERQNDISRQILKASGIHSKKKQKQLDEFLTQTWDDIFNALESKAEEKPVVANTVQNTAGNVTLDQIRQLLQEVLKDTKLNVQVQNVVPAAKVEEIEEVEELADEVEEIEEVEELGDEVEEIDEVEELADEVEEIEEVEELADEVEEIEEVEELADEVEEIEEIEEAEELADEVEEIEEVEELADEVEEIEEVEELADEVEEIEEVEELADEVEEIEEVEELADEVEEIEEIEEFIEEKNETDSGLELLGALGALSGPEYEYVDNNETFMNISDNFATVENVFAEYIGFGDEYIQKQYDSSPMEINIYKFDAEYVENEEDVVESKQEELEEIEELVEEVEDNKDNNKYFTMIRFGENTEKVEDLEGASKDTIVEKEGVFSIAENVETGTVSVDPDFKALVDSVLKS